MEDKDKLANQEEEKTSAFSNEANATKWNNNELNSEFSKA